MSWGQEGKGDFTYTSTADGKVTITLKNEQGQSYDRQWTISYKEEGENIVAMADDVWFHDDALAHKPTAKK